VNVLEEAIACHRAGDLGKAAELYLRLLEADDRNADAWHLMGLVASEQGQAADAVDFIRHAIRLAPASPVYHSNLGLALGRQERWDEAVDCYRTADVLDPNNPNILGKLGRALARLGKTDEAIGLLRRARDLAAHDADLWNALGSALAGGHHAEQAMPCFERALELDPAHDEARANLRSLGEEAAHEGEQAALRQDWAAAAAAFRRLQPCASWTAPGLHMKPRWRSIRVTRSRGTISDMSLWRRTIPSKRWRHTGRHWS
jgi:tetratricopeptide (TPR) repeat protein